MKLSRVSLSRNRRRFKRSVSEQIIWPARLFPQSRYWRLTCDCGYFQSNSQISASLSFGLSTILKVTNPSAVWCQASSLDACTSHPLRPLGGLQRSPRRLHGPGRLVQEHEPERGLHAPRQERRQACHSDRLWGGRVSRWRTGAVTINAGILIWNQPSL